MSKINDYGFPFTSVSEDRKYGSDQWRDYFDSLFSTGVIKSVGNQCEVTEAATPAKSVLVGTGAVLIKGATRILEDAETIAIEENTSGNSRIDVIVMRLNYTDRLIEFDVLKGTAAASPTAPTVTQNTTVWEVSLAEIAVANGFSTITNSEITDKRTYQNLHVDKTIEIVSVTASKTLALTDSDTLQSCSHAASAINLTVPPESSVAFPIGTQIAISMAGAAQVAVVAGSGVTINPSSTLKIYAQHYTAALVKIASDNWLLSGSLKA